MFVNVWHLSANWNSFGKPMFLIGISSTHGFHSYAGIPKIQWWRSHIFSSLCVPMERSHPALERTWTFFPYLKWIETKGWKPSASSWTWRLLSLQATAQIKQLDISFCHPGMGQFPLDWRCCPHQTCSFPLTMRLIVKIIIYKRWIFQQATFDFSPEGTRR